MAFQMRFDLRAESDDTLPEKRAFYVQLMRRLEELDVIDADFSGSIDAGDVSIRLAVENPALLDAVRHGLCAVRAAIHAADGMTPDWPDVGEVEAVAAGEGLWTARLVNTEIAQSSEDPEEAVRLVDA